MARKCALIESNPMFDEQFPALVYFFNRLGYTVDIYTHPDAFERNIFALMTGLSYNAHPLADMQYQIQYDVICFNSFEHLCGPEQLPSRIRSYLDIEYHYKLTPKIFIIHSDVPTWRDFFPHFFTPDPLRRFLVLAPHLQVAYEPYLPARWIVPAFMGSLTNAGRKKSFPLGNPVTFVLEGPMGAHLKNYDALLELVAQLNQDKTFPFLVEGIASHQTPFSQHFKQVVRERGLEQYFAFYDQGLGSERCFSKVAEADFILPLVDERHADTLLSKQAVKEINYMLALNTQGLVYAPLAEKYGLQDAVFTYGEGPLYAAACQAVSCSAEQREEKKRLLSEVQQRYLDQSLIHLKDTLYDIGLNTSSPLVTIQAGSN